MHKHTGKRIFTWLFAATVTLISTLPLLAAGLDAPHNGTANNIGCLSCHQMTSTFPKLLPPFGGTTLTNIDDTLANRVCWSCHSDLGGVTSVQTHSSLTTSSNHGDWTVECWVCHNQHVQEQNRYNGSTYGKYIRRSLNLANIKYYDSSDNLLPPREGKRAVKFLGQTGIDSFAEATGPADGVCQVCHTATGHWSAAAPAGDKHFSAWACTECHDHTTSFKPGWPDHDAAVQKPTFCSTCHANSVFGLHQADENTYLNCDRCHQVNNNYEFKGSLPTVYLKDRLTEHTGKGKHVFAATARCDDCHHGQFEEHVTDTGHNRLHDTISLGYDLDNDGSGDQVLACDACHFPDAIQEHVTRRNFTCSICHDRTDLGLPEVAAITATIAAGMAGTTVFCDDCHNDDHFLSEPGTSLVKEHHHTAYSKAGDCSKCHVVGPGERGPHRPPCWYCHATGKPGDPQRAGVNRHDQGPAITETVVNDFRACFSCHLAGGQGYLAGTTPLVTPMHGLPGTGPNFQDVYWPYGYYKDAGNQWVASDPLIPTATNPDIPANLENDPDRWPTWPGWHTLNYLGEKKYNPGSTYNDYTHPEVQDWARSGVNSIHNNVNIDYQRQDYPTVAISNGGTFEIPSFDGTGAMGKPAGSGSVSITLNPPEAVTAGAQWRLDGGIWHSSGDTIASATDRTGHLLEFKPLAGMDEPPPLQITVTNGQTTLLDGSASTYAICPDDPQLLVTRTSGDRASVFDWTLPEQVETFKTNGWRSGPVECEVWRQNEGNLVAAEGFAVQTSASGDGCRLSKTGATPAGPYDLVLRVTGSSCFRNTVDQHLAVTVTAPGAPSPIGQAGGLISELFHASLALPTSANHDFLHLAGNLYLHLNPSGVLTTFTINASGDISDALATSHLGFSGSVTRMAKVNDSLIAVSYNTGAQGSQASHIMTVGIEENGTVIAKKQDYLIHADYYSLRPTIYPHHDSNDLFIVTWVGYSNSPKVSFTGMLTVSINQFGMITELDRNTTMPNKGLNWKGTIVHVAGAKYAFVMSQDIFIFEVSAGGVITIPSAPGSSYRYAADAYYAEMIRVKDDIFAVAYTRGVSGIAAGVLETLSISDNGVISPTINTYLFEPCSSGYVDSPSLLGISDTLIGVSYFQYDNCDGQPGTTLKTIEITEDGRIMVPPLDSLELRGGGNVTPKLYHVGGDNYALLLHQDLSQGTTFSGVRTFGINTDNDRDGIASDTDNCDETANAGQADADADGTGDACDACPGFDDRLDGDSDGIPDACDFCAGHDDTIDSDADGTPDGCDPCPNDPSDDGGDHDGICVGSGFNGSMLGDNDNCPATENSDQVDSDCDGIGDACSTPADYTPATLSVSALTPRWLSISFSDSMRGEDGYRIEGKQGVCTDNTFSFTPLVAIYRDDRFDGGIDASGWVQGAVVQSGSTTTAPVAITDGSGTAEVKWENGQVRLHNVVNDMSEPGGFNYAYVTVNKISEVMGTGDFDVQVDFSLPEGAFSGTQYHSDVRLGFYFPQTDGKGNEALIERRNGYYAGYIVVNGVPEYGSIATTDLEGTLRLVRKNRQLASYILDDGQWVLVHKHSQPQIADLAPTWGGMIQYAQRNEPGGAELTAMVDNFRFNNVGPVPVPVLDLPMDEPTWQGASGEVKDATVGNNHGTSFNGATVVDDEDHGPVGRFDGTDDYVEVSGAGGLQTVTDASFTFAAWIKPDSVPPMQDQVNWTDVRYAVISRPGWHTSLHYDVSKTFQIEVVNDTGNFFVAGSPQYEPNAWHHVTGVVDDAIKEVRMYVDGVLTGTQAYTGTLLDYGTAPYYIGAANPPASSYTWHFSGLIDDARVFDRALSGTEVSALANNRLEFTAKGLTANTAYCVRAYPFKTDGCSNWPNHDAQGEATTLTSAAAAATTAGTATALSINGANTLYVNMPYFNDNNLNNSYTVEYKLSSAGTWTTHAAGIPHSASPYATMISGFTQLGRYDVRVTYADPDGVNGEAQQIIQGIAIGSAPSCLGILNAGGSIGDGIYWLDPDGAGSAQPYQAYCDMSSDGGGWTLAMKLDGSQTTFQYGASYWTTTNILNTANPDFDTIQAKLESFNTVPFTQVRLGMRNYSDPADDIDWITVNQSATSLVALFNSGFIATGVGRNNWLNLLEGVSTQPNCNKEGFNAEQSYSKMRIGLAMNNESDCTTCDRILGFGNDSGGHPWGAWAVVGGGYPGANTVAYGWIMVR